MLLGLLGVRALLRRDGRQWGQAVLGEACLLCILVVLLCIADARTSVAWQMRPVAVASCLTIGRDGRVAGRMSGR